MFSERIVTASENIGKALIPGEKKKYLVYKLLLLKGKLVTSLRDF